MQASLQSKLFQHCITYTHWQKSLQYNTCNQCCEELLGRGSVLGVGRRGWREDLNFTFGDQL
eukprot:3894457-Rhodomonas_salina.1